ncbi:hypothetical protein AAY473_008543 [Plecturocebus cupreus]
MLEGSGMIMAHWSLKLLGSSNPPASASQVAETTGTCHQAKLLKNFFFVETESYVAEAGLELPGSTIPPTPASQSARITGMSHHAQPLYIFTHFRLEYNSMVWAHYNLRLLGSSDSLASASQMGLHHVGQAGLKLLTSGDPPTLASQSAGITEGYESSEEKGAKSTCNRKIDDCHSPTPNQTAPTHKLDSPKRKRKTAKLAGSVGRFSKVTSLRQLDKSVHSKPKSFPIRLPCLGPEICSALSFWTLSATNK